MVWALVHAEVLGLALSSPPSIASAQTLLARVAVPPDSRFSGHCDPKLWRMSHWHVHPIPSMFSAGQFTFLSCLAPRWLFAILLSRSPNQPLAPTLLFSMCSLRGTPWQGTQFAFCNRSILFACFCLLFHLQLNKCSICVLLYSICCSGLQQGMYGSLFVSESDSKS